MRMNNQTKAKRGRKPLFELRPNVDEAKQFCQDWLLNGGAR